MREKYAIIVAAGKGLRMEEAIPKQFLPLLDKPLLYYSIHAFLKSVKDINILLVFPPDPVFSFEQEVLDMFPGKPVAMVRGGSTRFESVKNGLKRITTSSVIFVHDGVRPLVSTSLIQSCYKQALQLGSAIPAVPLKDSIRQVEEDTNQAADRNLFQSVQTPQTFLSEILIPAFNQPYRPWFTDEATVVEQSGLRVHLIRGAEENLKITHPGDLQKAAYLLRTRPE